MIGNRIVGVLRARWVVPVEGDPIADGALAVGRDGRIVGVGPAPSVACPAGGEVLDLGEAAVLPGLVNVHAHPELTLLRGAIEDRPFPEWIRALVEHKYQRLSQEACRASTLLGVAETIAAGVTTLAAPDDAGFLAEIMARARLRGVVYREVFGPDPRGWRDAFALARERVAEIRAHQTDLVRVGVSPHAPYTVSEPLLRALAEWAAGEGLPLSIHVAESEAEDRFVREGAGGFADAHRARGIPVQAHGLSPVELLERTGILETRPLLAHCVRVDEKDVARAAGAGAAVAHCPVSNAKLGHGVAPVASMLAAGIRVGLGSDSAASNNRVDILEEARVAGLLQRALGRSPDILPPATLLRTATLGGAEALGLADRTGSLRPGKDADVTVVRLTGLHTRPVRDPIATLIHSVRASDVILTVVRGEVLYRFGELTTLDIPAAETC